LNKLLIYILLTVSAYSNCESGHWIDNVMSNGEIIKLEDGSLWKVNSSDTYNSAIWIAIDNIVICDDNKLINTDDNTAVSVNQIK